MKRLNYMSFDILDCFALNTRTPNNGVERALERFPTFSVDKSPYTTPYQRVRNCS